MVSSIDISTSGTLPKHVAIIMDGNNRWAKKRFMPGVAGHKAGVKSVRTVVEKSAKLGIDVLTLFAFSSENWRRPPDEVSALMELFTSALEKQVRKLHEHNIRLRVIGDLTAFSARIQELISNAQHLTAQNTGLTLVIAANYGGQWDIVESCKALCRQVQKGELALEAITEQEFHQYVSLADLPPPDLLIRTGGEQRISNFILWQAAYAELFFSDVLWPDYGEHEYEQALTAYTQRVRRFGRTDGQLKGKQ